MTVQECERNDIRMKHLPRTILRLRKERHLSRRELAERSGLSPSAIVQIEGTYKLKGRWDIHLSTLQALARGLNLTMYEMIDELQLEVVTPAEASCINCGSHVNIVPEPDLDGVG